MRGKRQLAENVWYGVRTEVNIGEPLFRLTWAQTLLYRALLETMAHFGFEMRGFKLDGAWLSFYIKPADGLELPKIMQWVKQISSDGLTVQTVALALRSAVDGMVSTVYRENDEEYDIRVKIEDSALRDIEDLKNIPVLSPAGIFHLSRYADMRFASGSNMIMRVDKQRTANITAELLPGYAQGPVLADVMNAAAEIDLPQGYHLQQAGLSEVMGESNAAMAVVFLSAILLVYMLLAAILESPLQPLFILSTIPLSLIGVAAGCLLFGTVLNNIAMIGIVMLVGVVVNNAILMLDYYNRLKREGRGAVEALIKACPAKLKTILMSNIAIILGMIPMALGAGASLAEMRQPMGIITIGGIVSSTVLTLWFIPAIERLVVRRASKRNNKGNSK